MSMKLSEAIRLSTTIMPQVYGPIYKRNRLGKVCGACRVGAVALTVGYQPKWRFETWHGEIDESREVMLLIDAHWPWWRAALRRNDVPFYMYLGAATYIAYCHEELKLTADQIADHVAILEAKYANDPVTMDVTPNRAGDALQPTEVL